MKTKLLLLIVLTSLLFAPFVFASMYSAYVGTYEDNAINFEIILEDIYNMDSQGARHWSHTVFNISCDMGFVIASEGSYVIVDGERYDFGPSDGSNSDYFVQSSDISLDYHMSSAELNYIICEEEYIEDCKEVSVNLSYHPDPDSNPAWGEGVLIIEETD